VLLAANPAVAIAINGLTFLISAAAVAAIGARRAFAPAHRDADEPLPSVLADIRTGARALRGAPTAVRLIAADVICSVVYGVLTVTLVLLGHRLGAGGSGYGLLLGAFGAGGILGAAVSGRLDAPGLLRRTLAAALLLVALTLLVLASGPSLAEALGAAVIGGAGMIVGEVLSETALPRTLGDDVLARAYGLVVPASVVGIVAGSLVAGPLVALLGLSGALAATGVGVLIAGGMLVGRPLSATGPVTAVA
jgi:predicted MFS family arabinose efflux permease